MNPTLVVFRKELRDMFRDKRVRTSAFFMPVLLIIGLMYLFGSVISSLEKKEGQKVYVVKTSHPLLKALESAKAETPDGKSIPGAKPLFDVIPVDSVQAGEELIRKGEAKVVLDFGAVPATDGKASVVKAYLDPKEQTSQIDEGRIEEFFARENKAQVGAYLMSKGLDAKAQELIKVEKVPVKVGEASAGEMVISLLPYLIVVWAFWGGMSIVADLVAGEKEKNTLETLLITPVRRTQIVLGKFFSLCVVCLLSSSSSIVGLALYGLIKPPGSDKILEGGLGLTPLSVVITLLVLIPTVALFASLLIAVSSYAKNTREAQTHLSALSFIVIMPAIFVQFLGLTDLGKQMWINFVPVLNTGANIRAAFLGKAQMAPVIATVAVSLVLALVALRVAVGLFNREQILTRV